jgi:transcriptional regulator with XRE-family HTH domain
MGTRRRPKPAHLATKLLEIRTKLELSQNGMIRRMGVDNQIVQADVSAYERGLREPPLYILLHYARAANILVERLIDDEIDLPERLPSTDKQEWAELKRVRP